MQVKEGLQQPKRGLIILGYLHALASVSLSCTFSLLGAASGTAKGNLIRWEHQYVGWVWMREMIQDCSAGEFKICVIPHLIPKKARGSSMHGAVSNFIPIQAIIVDT